MTYRGHVKNGQILLDRPVPLPDGAEVSVEIVEAADEAPASVLSKVAALAVEGGLPRDYSEQHEHYVKGTPRK